jgi:mannosyl-3-phosphoglycerate synthase
MRDGRLFFSRKGRASEVTNHFLNRLIAEYSGFGTEVVTTGNAGEHALTLDLGLRMRLAGGFAVEPFEFVDLFEQFGGVVDSPHPEVMASSVSVRQIETRNPHFHEDKGDSHVRDMRLQALNVLYHSPVCLPAVREDIGEFMHTQGALEPGLLPPRERVYPPLSSLALERVLDVLITEAESFRQVERRFPAGVRLETPINRAAPVVPIPVARARTPRRKRAVNGVAEPGT